MLFVFRITKKSSGVKESGQLRFARIQFQRRTLHVPNLIQLREEKLFFLIYLRFGTCKARRLNWAQETVTLG